VGGHCQDKSGSGPLSKALRPRDRAWSCLLAAASQCHSLYSSSLEPLLVGTFVQKSAVPTSAPRSQTNGPTLSRPRACCSAIENRVRARDLQGQSCLLSQRECPQVICTPPNIGTFLCQRIAQSAVFGSLDNVMGGGAPSMSVAGPCVHSCQRQGLQVKAQGPTVTPLGPVQHQCRTRQWL